MSKPQTKKNNHKELLSVLSHDLRNPLGVALITTTLLERMLDGDPKTKRHIDALKRATREMSNVIDDMLDVAQIDEGDFVVTMEKLDAKALIEAAHAQATQELNHGPFTVRNEIEEELPALRGERARLLQVFAQIVKDAARFMPNGGTITLGAHAAQRNIRFFIRDTGPEIPDADRRLLFARRAPKNRKVCRGTGLRMFLAKAIIEAHGGRVDVRDKTRQGNTIAFVLPLANEAKVRREG